MALPKIDWSSPNLWFHVFAVGVFILAAVDAETVQRLGLGWDKQVIEGSALAAGAKNVGSLVAGYLSNGGNLATK